VTAIVQFANGVVQVYKDVKGISTFPYTDGIEVNFQNSDETLTDVVKLELLP
jgi:hypothetical protein